MTLRQLYLPLVLVICLGTAAMAGSSYPPPTNIRITVYPELNNEEQVFICPTDSNIIIANWRDFRLGYRQIGIGRSTDAGQTWTDSLVAKLMQYFSYDSQQSDPTLTVDRYGNFYMCNLDWDAFGFTGKSLIAFYKSTDQGISWTGPVPNTIPSNQFFEDKQFITADRTGGTYDGNVYCSWTRFYGPADPPDRILVVRSIDGAASFEDTVTVGPNQTSTGCGSSLIDAGQFSIPIVNSNGDVHVFWQGYALDSGGTCSGVTTIKHVVSTDGGQIFTYEDTVLSVSGYTSADGGINTYSQPVGDADLTGGPFGGNMYIAFTNEGPEDAGNTDVDFIRSTDNCVTWSQRIQINDDPNSVAIDAFHPWLVVNDEGVIIVVFYDQRYDPPGYYLFDMMAAYSFDGGLTFTSNHRISDVSSSPGNLKNIDQRPLFEIDENGIVIPLRVSGRAGLIGEYIGVTAFHDKVNAVWTDSRDGNSEVYTANWYLPILEPKLIVPPDGVYLPPYATFEWSTSWKHNLDRYRIEISTDSTFLTDVISAVVDTNFFPKDTITSEGLHYWRVKAFNTAGTDSSEYSEVWSFDVDWTPPEVPTLLEPEDGKVTNEPTPTFDWTTSTRLSSPVVYDLYVSIDSTFPAGPDTRVYANLPESYYTPVDTLPDSVVSYWRVDARDGVGNSSSSVIYEVTFIPYICGDVDGSVAVDVGDLSYLVGYLFQSGPPPPVLAAADVDGSGFIDVADLTYLVQYLFQGGPQPIC
ncbi:MAG: dockerin type I domain-containing protein [bacterium]